MVVTAAILYGQGNVSLFRIVLYRLLNA